jgi:hypothetical protein
MDEIKDILRHLVTWAGGYRTQADRQAHLDRIEQVLGDAGPAPDSGQAPEQPVTDQPQA